MEKYNGYWHTNLWPEPQYYTVTSIVGINNYTRIYISLLYIVVSSISFTTFIPAACISLIWIAINHWLSFTNINFTGCQWRSWLRLAHQPRIFTSSPQYFYVIWLSAVVFCVCTPTQWYQLCLLGCSRKIVFMMLHLRWEFVSTSLYWETRMEFPNVTIDSSAFVKQNLISNMKI